MKKFFLIIALICGGFPSFSSSTDLLFNQTNFSKGVNTNDLPDTIQDDQVVNAENMWFNKNNGITRRNGFGVKVTTRAVAASNSWVYQDPSGNEWLLVLYTDGVLIAGKSLGGGNNFSIIVSTNISTSQSTDGDTGLGKFWLSNKQNGLMWWDGVNFTTSSIAPLAGSVRIWRNRVCLGDISNELSSVRLSGELNGEDWTDNSRFSTSPISIRIGGVNDGTRVYGLSVGLDELLVFKKRSIYGIAGNDQRDFYVRQISDSIGSIYPKTARQYYSSTLLLSNRGLDKYTPPSLFEFIGDPVKNQLDALAILGSVNRYQSISNQNQFGDGVSVPENNISSTIVSGDLSNFYFSTGDTSTQDFSVGSIVNPVTFNFNHSYSSASDMLVFNSSAIVGKVFNAGLTGPANWLFRSAAPTGGGVETNNVGAAGDFAWRLEDDAGVAVTVNYSSHIVMSGKFTWDTTASAGKYGRLTIYAPVCCNDFLCQTQGYYVLLSTSFSVNFTYINNDHILVQVLEMPVFSTPTVQRRFTSQPFDKHTISSNTHLQFLSDYIVTNSTLNFSVRESSDALNWTEFSISTPINLLENFNKRYLQYVASMSAVSLILSSQASSLQINDVTLREYATGYFQLLLNPGGNLTSWGLFTANTNGSITFRVQGSSDSILEDNQWVSQVVNSTIPQGAFPYLGVKTLFYTQFATMPASAYDFTINWNEGETPPIPMAGTNQDSYFLFFGTVTGNNSINDSVIIYEKATSLTKFSGIHGGGVTEYLNKLTVSDAQQTGNIFVLELSTDGKDNGVGVLSNVMFKRIGSQIDKKKDWEYFFFTLSRTDASLSQIFRVTYYLDGATTTWFTDNIELSTGTFAGNFKSIVPGDNKVESQFIDIKLEELTQGFPYSIHGVRGYGTLVDIR